MVMLENIGEPAMLEQMAEECCELSKALLKRARVLRGENPTPITEKESKSNIIEEWSDVMQCALELKLTDATDWCQIARKTERFVRRLEDAHKVQVRLP